MDAETVIWLLVMLVWFVSGIVKQIRGMGKKDGAPAPAAPPVPRREAPPEGGAAMPTPSLRPAAEPQGPAAGTSLQELFRQLGVEPVEEEPVASEHRQTASEHRQTASEHRATRSERRVTYDEHRQTDSELMATASEHQQTLSEHRQTLSEHLPGDVTGALDRSQSGAYRQSRRRGPSYARDVRQQLRADHRSLARAWLMKEILGPPPGLGPQGQNSS